MIADDVLMALWRSTLSTSFALGVVFALRLPTRRALGAQTAYALWLLVPGTMVAMWLPAPTHPLLATLPILQNVSVGASLAMASASDAAMRGNPASWIFAIWLAGVVGLAARLLWQQRRYVRALGRLIAGGDGTVRAENDEAGPALIGAWRPRIVLPRDFEARFDARERELVLAHERTHRARGDAQINALVAMWRCVQWFNPLVHYAAACLRIDQEMACDALVMSRFPETRRCYADAMLKAQRVGESRQELRLPAGCHWPSRHPLKERILMLKFPVLTARRQRLAHAVVVALLFGVGYASWAAQPGAASRDHTQSAMTPVAPASVSPIAGRQMASSSETPAATNKPATSIQLGELQNIAPSTDIGYRRMKPPVYPPEAVKTHVGAKVVLKVLIDTHGNAKSVDVERIDILGEPRPNGADGEVADKATLIAEFTRVSKSAAMSWKYNPGRKNGKPYEGYALVPIDFTVAD